MVHGILNWITWIPDNKKWNCRSSELCVKELLQQNWCIPSASDEPFPSTYHPYNDVSATRDDLPSCGVPSRHSSFWYLSSQHPLYPWCLGWGLLSSHHNASVGQVSSPHALWFLSWLEAALVPVCVKKKKKINPFQSGTIWHVTQSAFPYYSGGVLFWSWLTACLKLGVFYLHLQQTTLLNQNALYMHVI